MQFSCGARSTPARSVGDSAWCWWQSMMERGGRFFYLVGWTCGGAGFLSTTAFLLNPSIWLHDCTICSHRLVWLYTSQGSRRFWTPPCQVNQTELSVFAIHVARLSFLFSPVSNVFSVGSGNADVHFMSTCGRPQEGRGRPRVDRVRVKQGIKNRIFVWTS